MQKTHWRVLLSFAVLVLLLVTDGAARAAETKLDEPGTYLIEVSSGRPVRIGQNAVVAWSPDSQTVAVAEPLAGASHLGSVSCRLRTVPPATSSYRIRARSTICGGRQMARRSGSR